jgi:hypothetical protein
VEGTMGIMGRRNNGTERTTVLKTWGENYNNIIICNT